MTYDPSEQDEVILAFTEMLVKVTQDGGRKRAKGDKVSWKVDPGHEAGLFSHLSKWKKGELVDPDSGAHPLQHLAWRALAIAWQETREDRLRENPRRVAGTPFTPTPEIEGVPQPRFIMGGVQKVSTPTGCPEHKPDCDGRCQGFF